MWSSLWLPLLVKRTFLPRWFLPIIDFQSSTWQRSPPSGLKPLSTIPSNNPAETQTPTCSFTLAYLINSCGLSHQSAISASRKIQLKSAENPDTVLACFRNHGFTETQIKSIILKWPRFLLANPEKTILPKLQYFQDLGIPPQMLTKAFSSGPTILTRSLDNKIVPYVDFIKPYTQSSEDVIVSIYRMKRFLHSDFRMLMESNIKILREHDVPESSIAKLIVHRPTALMAAPDRFYEIASMVREMGFDPSTRNFSLAIVVASLLSRSSWEEKMNVYRSLGWSLDELLSAFRLQPIIMWVSEEKIKRVVSFFVNEMGWKPCDLARHPGFLLLSLEKRIVPRCSVMRILWAKDVEEKHFTLRKVLTLTDEAFIEKFVIKYQEHIPEILTMYRAKMGNSKSEESTKLKL